MSYINQLFVRIKAYCEGYHKHTKERMWQSRNRLYEDDTQLITGEYISKKQATSKWQCE